MAYRVLLLCLVFAVASGLSDAGHLRIAAAADRTELLIREGVELRRLGKNEEAAKRFAKAYEQSHTPRAAAQLGLCEQALERWVEADLHLSEGLAGGSEPWVARNRKTLEESLAKTRSKLATLVIEGPDQTAQVHVNGEYVGNLPDKLTIRVLPGATEVTASATGFAPFAAKIPTEASKQHKVAIVMKALLPEISALKPLVPTGGPGLTDSATPAPVEPSPSPSRTWLWVGGGVVAAILVGVVVFAASGTTYPDVDATRDFPPK